MPRPRFATSRAASFAPRAPSERLLFDRLVRRVLAEHVVDDRDHLVPRPGEGRREARRAHRDARPRRSHPPDGPKTSFSSRPDAALARSTNEPAFRPAAALIMA